MNNVHLDIIGSTSFHSILKELDLNYVISLDGDVKYNNDYFLVRIIFAEEIQLTNLKYNIRI